MSACVKCGYLYCMCENDDKNRACTLAMFMADSLRALKPKFRQMALEILRRQFPDEWPRDEPSE